MISLKLRYYKSGVVFQVMIVYPLYEMRVASGQAKRLGGRQFGMAMIIKNAEVNGIIKDILLEKCLLLKSIIISLEANFYDAKGDALIPGLHDHHIHLNSTAVAINSVICGPPDVSNEIELIEKIKSPRAWMVAWNRLSSQCSGRNR